LLDCRNNPNGLPHGRKESSHFDRLRAGRLYAAICDSSGPRSIFANKLSDAQAALYADHFDMIMVGVHFD
jgi:hypothetical protein